jgi:hypothetical protein
LAWDITDRVNLNAQVRHLDGYYSDVANTKSHAIDGSNTVADAAHELPLQRPGAGVHLREKRVRRTHPTYMQTNRG